MALTKLSYSCRELISILEKKSPLTQKELLAETDVAARTVRFALNRLIELGLIVKRCNLNDTRSVYYFLSNQTNFTNWNLIEELGFIQNEIY